MQASRHGRYDEAKRTALDELTEHERGLRFSPDPLFNSLVPESWSGLTAGVRFQPEEIDAALTRTELRWRPMPSNETPIRFTLSQIDGCLRLDMWSGGLGPANCAMSRTGIGPAGRRTPAGRRRARRRGQRPDTRTHQAGTPPQHPRPDTDRPLLDRYSRHSAPGRRRPRASGSPGLRFRRRPPAGRLPDRHRHRPHPRTGTLPLHGHPRPPPDSHHPPPLRHLPHRTLPPSRPRRLAPTPDHRHRPRLSAGLTVVTAG